MSSSSPDFDRLFATSTDKKLYYLDTIYSYKSAEEHQSLVNLEAYFSTVTSARLSKIDKTIVEKISKKLPQLPQGYTPFLDWENASKDTVSVSYNLAPFDATAFKQILDILRTSVGGKQNIETSHDVAHNYMVEIVSSACQSRYNTLKKLIHSNVGDNNPKLVYNAVLAVNRVNELTGGKEQSVLHTLRTTCSDALDHIVQNKMFSDLGGFNENPVFNENPFRFALREIMYEKLILREVEESNDDILQYMKRVLVDLYIVSFYPLIHFLYITQLLKRFKKNGDFMNMRVASFVKVTFTIHTLLKLHDKASAFITASDSQFIMKLVDNLKAYLTNLSNVKFSNSKYTLGDAATDLHELSKKVNMQSMSVDELKRKIAQTQLNIRSNLGTFKGINEALWWKKFTFNVLVGIVVIILVLSFVMLKLNLYVDYLMYGHAGIIAIILIAKLITIIIELTR
jgi:hypothetical protein